MGDVGKAWDDLFNAPLKEVDKVISGKGSIVFSIAEQLVHIKQVIDVLNMGVELAKNVNDIRNNPTKILTHPQDYWRFYSSAIILGGGPVGAYFGNRIARRIEKDKYDRMIGDSIAAFHRGLIELAAIKTSGELRLLQQRIAATYVGNRTFITDSKPPYWRMYAELFQIRLISSDDWRRHSVFEGSRLAMDSDMQSQFLHSAQLIRSRY